MDTVSELINGLQELLDQGVVKPTSAVYVVIEEEETRRGETDVFTVQELQFHQSGGGVVNIQAVPEED